MNPYQKIFFIFGALFGLTAFIAGAFGSHLLKKQWTADALAVYEVAVRYHMYHALVLMTLAWATGFFSSLLIPIAGWFFIIGVIIFCGSLYSLVFSGIRWWGIITPIGGVILLVGWSLLFLGGFLSTSS